MNIIGWILFITHLSVRFLSKNYQISLITTLLIKHSAMIYKSQFEFNKNYIDFNLSSINDGIHDTILNAAVENFKPVESVFIYIEARTAESKTDENYQRLMFRTNIDLSRFLKGITGNFLSNLFVDPIIKSLGFNLTLPIPAVSNCIFGFSHIEDYLIFEYHRNCMNLKISQFMATCFQFVQSKRNQY